MGESLAAEHAEDVTAERLGASRWPLQAFRSACCSEMRRGPVSEREASAAVWAAGDWRGLVAEDAGGQLDRAGRLTGADGAPQDAPGRPGRVARPRGGTAMRRWAYAERNRTVSPAAPGGATDTVTIFSGHRGAGERPASASEALRLLGDNGWELVAASTAIAGGSLLRHDVLKRPLASG